MKCLKVFDPKMRTAKKTMIVAEIQTSAKTGRNFGNCAGGSGPEFSRAEFAMISVVDA
ncbi:MAG TPA: hypothetical protein VIW23_06525 [Candidatus Acidoferrum sp.]|jgi:hypothetical protein